MTGSVSRKIFTAAITVGLMTVLVKTVTVLKELIVAWRFGTGDAIDAFLIALLIPAFVISVVSGSFNTALIPTYIWVREKEGLEAAQKLFSGAMIWSLGLLGIATGIVIAPASLYLPWIARGFSPEKLSLTLHLLWAITPLIPLSGLLTMWAAVLNAGERFALAALAPVITPFVTVILLLAFTGWSVFALAIGLICGAILELALLGSALKRQGISVRPRWYGFDSHLRKVASQFAPMIAGAVLMSSTSLVDQSMAAMLSPGSVAALNYGNKLIALPIGLAFTALSTAVIPYFSKMVACENWVEVRSTLKRYLWLVFVTTVPLTGLIVFLSQSIVEITLQRGSFSAENTYIVAQIQAFYALQIPVYIASILMVRLISAMRLNHILMWGSGVNLLLNIGLNYIFLQWMGLQGIALSTSCVYAFSFLYLLFHVQKELKKTKNRLGSG